MMNLDRMSNTVKARDNVIEEMKVATQQAKQETANTKS